MILYTEKEPKIWFFAHQTSKGRLRFLKNGKEKKDTSML